MKTLFALLLTATVVVACDQNHLSPTEPQQITTFPQNAAQDAILASRARSAAEERAAYDRVFAHFRSTEQQVYIKQQLAVPGRRIEVPNDKIGQGLIDTYYAKQIKTMQANEIRVVPTTVALVDKLDAPDAVAVVIRRPGQQDTILLPEESASAASLGSAVTALYAIRAREGDIASQNTRLTVANAVMPRHWRDGLAAAAAKTLSDLKHVSKRDLKGIGIGRATQILMVGI